MPGKRKRRSLEPSEPQSANNGNGNPKPISAVAAAKLRSQESQEDATMKEVATSPAPDPSASELSSSESEEDEEDVIYRNQQLCTFRPGPSTVLSDTDDELVVHLKKNTTISFIGCFDIVVLKGAINVNGANFAANPRQGDLVQGCAHVPSTHPITSIKGLDTRNEVKFLSCTEPTSLANLSPLYADIWHARKLGSVGRSFSLIIESDGDPLNRRIAPENIPEDWVQEVEECTIDPHITFLVGASLSGTSHFARRLINRFLTGHGKNARPLQSVFYLDLDPGNPTYTPHGQVTLILVRKINTGPDFLNASTTTGSAAENEVIRAHAVPFQWSQDFVKHFVACAEDLIHTYSSIHHRDRNIPLVINTPGWLYSKGFDGLISLLSRIKPQRLVHLTNLESIDEVEAAKLDTLEATARNARTIIRQVSSLKALGETSRTDADLRSMQMLSYFHRTGRKPNDGHQHTFNSKPLSFTAPIEFSYEQTETSYQALIGFQLLTEWVDPNQIMTVLNGSIIHIVQTEDETVQAQVETLPRTSKFHIPYFEKLTSGAVEPLNPKTSSLVCTALLRGWDCERRVAQIIVPKTHKRLVRSLAPEKTVFVFGCCEHPEWAYTEDAYYDLSEQAGGLQTELNAEELGPWVVPASKVEAMGYLNVPRRIRRFHGGD